MDKMIKVTYTLCPLHNTIYTPLRDYTSVLDINAVIYLSFCLCISYFFTIYMDNSKCLEKELSESSTNAFV